MDNRSLILNTSADGLTTSIESSTAQLETSRGDLLLRVLFSSVNYKDGLAITGKGKIVRAPFPFVPGIDLVGEVVESNTNRYSVGEILIGTGWQIGEVNPGGYTNYQTVHSDWMVPLPAGMTPEESMVVGTAGFTAMLSVMALEDAGIEVDSGEIVVTGATGGVGSMAVSLLSRLGYEVVASTGKQENAYLKKLGASRIIPRSELSEGPYRPLDNGKWAGAVDSVGGTTLATILSQMELHGAVAACGLAASHDLITTVFPFILRGVQLLGIDSNFCPFERRKAAWDRIADTLGKGLLHEMKRVISLSEVPDVAEQITEGKVKGRVVVDLAR